MESAPPLTPPAVAPPFALPIRPADAHFWVHDINPYAVVFGHWHGHTIGVRWYGLAYVLGLACGWWLLARWSRQGRSPLRPDQIESFIIHAGLGMLLGGRIGYCLFYGWDQLVADPFYLLRVYDGGMASHGGIIGLAIGSWIFARRSGIALPVLADMVSAAAPIGVMFGRAANFINGELWGRESHVPWAVIFPDSPPVDGYLVPRHPSTLYAIVLEGLIPLLVALPIHKRHRRPGLTSGVVLIVYAIGRFIDEFFRAPDVGKPGSPGHPPILGFMSEGQALTLPVMVIGVAWVIWALSRPPRPELYAPPSPPAENPGADQAVRAR